MKVRDLGPNEGITLQCTTCQLTVRWAKGDLEREAGPWAELRHIGLHERLRCQGCGQPPSNAWPSWQPQRG
jgi:ferredoxin